MKTQTTHSKHTLLATALAVLIAPGISLAGGGKNTGMSADAKDAYREGQIWATYVTNPSLDAMDLKVDVQGDKATISGNVESAVQKRLAERIADRTDGIDRVENRIKVDPKLMVVTVVEPVPTFATYVADATLEAMVESKLLWNQYTDAMDIDVTASRGVITLTGIADTQNSRDLAGRLAASTPGARLVRNQLTLDPDQHGGVVTAAAPDGDDYLSDTWITAKTNSSLLWTSGVQGTDIDVTTRDGVVTLTGTVETRFEKDLAIEVAQGVRGVQRVDASGLKLESNTNQVSQR